MKRRTPLTRLAGLVLLVLFFFGLAAPARAFTPYGGDQVVIEAGQVINDDVYTAAQTVVVKGTIQGDLIAFGSAVVIEDTGRVTGDLLAAGEGVVIKGQVGDTARLAGAVLAVGPEATIGGDLVAVGYTLEVQPGGKIGRDLVVLASGVALNGQVSRNMQVQSEGLLVSGQVGGNLIASVGGKNDAPLLNIMSFIPAQPILPAPTGMMGGLVVTPEARIEGDLIYTGPQEVRILEEAVAGQVTYTPLPPEPVTAPEPAQPTPAEQAFDWLAGTLRSLATLLLVGLLLSYFFPDVLRRSADILQSRPAPSLGWGLLAYVGFFFLLSVITAMVIILMIVFGTVTLNDLLWTTLGLGAMAFTALTVVFKVAASYVSKIIAGYLIGRLIFRRWLPAQAESLVWPAVVGIVLFVLLTELPVVGGILNFVVILLGLGALFLLFRESYHRLTKPAAL